MYIPWRTVIIYINGEYNILKYYYVGDLTLFYSLTSCGTYFILILGNFTSSAVLV